jgi:hypothetical protein
MVNNKNKCSDSDLSYWFSCYMFFQSGYKYIPISKLKETNMKKREKEQKGWITYLQNYLENCRLKLEDVEKLEAKNIDKHDAMELLREFRKMMEEIQRGADHIYEEIVSIPLATMCSVNRLQLTEEQFYLTRVAGISLFTAKRFGICAVDNFEVYRNSIYEDSKSVGFMAPNETPVKKNKDKKTGKSFIRLRLACSPEETCLENYRPEQIRFFQKYRPDVISRAKKVEEKETKTRATAITK